jgi:hypothetical protein
MADVYVKHVEQTDHRLGRFVAHDPASRGFARRVTIDTSTWKTKRIRLYDPLVNPNQCHGECTMCANAMMLNALGNRVRGEVLGMDYAHQGYSIATQLDPFAGTWAAPNWEDTGSNGLAAAKAAQHLGKGGTYHWFFGGADEIVQHFMDDDDPIPVSAGTWWYDGQFRQDSKGFIAPTGSRAGGHQYIYRGYVEPLDALVGRCWWGGFRDFLIKREHANDLLMDDGDAHTQERAA